MFDKKKKLITVYIFYIFCSVFGW